MLRYQTKLRFPGFGQHNNQSKRHGHIEGFANKEVVFNQQFTWISAAHLRYLFTSLSRSHVNFGIFVHIESHQLLVISRFLHRYHRQIDESVANPIKNHQESPANWWIPSNLEEKYEIINNHGFSIFHQFYHFPIIPIIVTGKKTHFFTAKRGLAPPRRARGRERPGDGLAGDATRDARESKGLGKNGKRWGNSCVFSIW